MMKNYVYPMWCHKCARVDDCYQNSMIPKCFVERIDESGEKEPCSDCQEFDCYGCEYEYMKRRSK